MAVMSTFIVIVVLIISVLSKDALADVAFPPGWCGPEDTVSCVKVVPCDDQQAQDLRNKYYRPGRFSVLPGAICGIGCGWFTDPDHTSTAPAGFAQTCCMTHYGTENLPDRAFFPIGVDCTPPTY